MIGKFTVLDWRKLLAWVRDGILPSPNGLPSFVNVPIANGLTLTSNSPSGGSITWNDFILTYQGIQYAVTGGNSSDKYIYWSLSSPTNLTGSTTPPGQAADQFIIAFNESGTAILALFTNTIYADYINVTDLAAININTGSLDISGVLSIGASGGLYQGTGSFGTPTTGLKIWNNGGIGTLATYSAGTLQVELDTGGNLLAGGGEVTLNASGIQITTPLSSSAVQTNSLQFVYGGALLGRVAQYLSSGTSPDTSVLDITVENVNGYQTELNLNALAPSTETAQINLSVSSVGAPSINIISQVGEPTLVNLSAGSTFVALNGTSVTLATSGPQLIATSTLLEWQYKGSNVFTVDTSGNLTATGSLNPGVDASSISITIPSGSRGGIHFQDATAAKTLRVSGGSLQVLNAAFSTVVLSVDDSGNAATAGHLQIGNRPAFASGDKYLVVDSSGNVHVSSLGPAS